MIQRLMASAAAKNAAPPYSETDFLSAQDPAWAGMNRSRERDECRTKLQNLGLLEIPIH